MDKFKCIPCLLLVLFLAGCAGVRVDLQKSVGCQPQLNVESEAHVGDVVFSQWNMLYKEFPYTGKANDYRTKLGTKLPIGPLSYVTGEPPFVKVNAGDELYCGNRIEGYRMVDCLISSDGKTLTKHFLYGSVLDPEDIEPIHFTKAKMIIVPMKNTLFGVESTIFKYDLVLLGVEGGSVKLVQKSYAEKFLAIMGQEKPTNIQEFSFHVGQLPFVATIGKLQLQITAVEGDSVKYRVLVPFESNRDWNPQ